MELYFYMLFLYLQLTFKTSEPETWFPAQGIHEDSATAPEVSNANHELL